MPPEPVRKRQETRSENQYHLARCQWSFLAGYVSAIVRRSANISRPPHPMWFACQRLCARRSPASHIIWAGTRPLLQFRPIIIASRYS